MSDRRDQTDDPIESELRSWFKSRRTPAAPSTLRAFADEVGSRARPTAPVRRLAFGWRQAAPGGRLAAAATTIAIVVLAGGLLVVSGQRGPAASTAAPTTSPPAQAASASTSPMPSALGACSADQFVLGAATSAYGFGTLGTTSVTVTQALRNAGGNCVLDLPRTIRVASATGAFQAVGLVDAGAATSFNIQSGQSLSVVLRAWWSLVIAPSGGTPLPTPPCADPTSDVSRVEIPVGAGNIEIDLDIPWHEVCTSPASVSLTFVTEAAAPSSPAPSPDVTARYPDGIPSTYLGQHVYRPSDLLRTVPTGPFLLGGWDAGPLAVSCPNIVPGASSPRCPSFEALAETRGGPMVVGVGWGAFPVPGAPALVLRVTAEPAPTCVSIPPGSCPGPYVTVQDVLWAGDPSASTPSPTPIPTAQIPTQPPAQATSTWSKVTLPTIVTQPVTFGGPGGGPSALPGGGFIDFVPAAADRMLVLTSSDGSAWTQVGEITGQDALGVTGPVAFNGHVYVALGGEGGGGFYGMQSNGAAWVSTDLIHWTKAPAQEGLGGAIFRGIAAGTVNFVAIGDSEVSGPTVWTSPDGLHWAPVLVKSVFPFDLSEATGIAQTSHGLVIVGRIGEQGATWTSPDGQTWTVHSPLPSGSGFFNGLAKGPAGFVSLVGAPSGAIEVAPGDFRAPVTPWASADGVTWHAGPSSPALFGAHASIVGVPGGYLAVGQIGLDVTEYLWSSTDGTTWVPVAGVDLGSDSTVALVSDGRHVLLWISGPGGLQVLVSDGVHG
jgi:hypothetical protein